MELSIHVRLFLLCSLTVFLSECDPIAPVSWNGRGETIGSNLFDSFDDAANFLRIWFSRIRRKVDNILNNDQQSERARLRRSVSKKEIRPPPSFEILERAYLLTLSKKHLEQLFGYVKFINQDNETRTQIDQLMEEQVARLQKMTLEQLKVYCAKLQTAMKNGISLNHEITVNGRRYSLESIAQVCCPWG